MVGGYFDGRADEGGDGAGAAGAGPGRDDLARAQVGDRHENQASGRAVLVGEGDRHVGDGVAERDGVMSLPGGVAVAFQLGWFWPVLAQVAESGAGVLTRTSDV
jgi:hypothetical protein